MGIIIPTYNRFSILKKTLEALETQSLDKEKYIVTVVDDGSVDGTYEKIMKMSFTFDFKLLRQKNQGCGVARNLAIQHTDASYILLYGDDIIPVGQKFLQNHLEALEKSDGRTAFLGYITWHPTIKKTPFLFWMENGGPLLNYRGLVNSQGTDFWHFYGSNISLPRKYLLEEKFDPLFKGYGFEDIEIGYRLQKKFRLSIQFLEEAKTWHNYPVDENLVWQRIPQMKQAAKYFEQKHSEVKIFPTGWRKMVLKIATSPLLFFLLGTLKKEWRWYLSFKKAFLSK